MSDPERLTPSQDGGVGGATCTPTAQRAWPLAPGEHSDLPRLRVQLHDGRPAVAGRKPTTAIPPHVRILFSPLGVVDTSNPDRLRGYATQLIAAANLLEAEHATFAEHAGQLPLLEDH